MTQEGETQRKDHDALLQTLENLRTQEKASEDAIHQLEVTVERQGDSIKRLEEDLNAQQEDSLAKFARYEIQIAGHKEKTQTTIAMADERFNKAQDMANERILELEESLDAEKKLGREATEKLEGDLKTAREHIECLLSTIRSNSQELQMYRDRAKVQRQAGPSGYPNHPAPMPFPPAQSGMQSSLGQSPFGPRPTQIPGFPPNRASGFMGNTPPPGWGRGAGAGGGTI